MSSGPQLVSEHVGRVQVPAAATSPLLTSTKAPHHTSPAVPSLWGLWVSPCPHIGVPHGAGVQGRGDNFLWLGTLGATGLS